MFIKMLFCPIQNTAEFTSVWIQKRPRVTQEFGLNPQIYKRFGMDGHNGIDYGVKVGTPIFAPIEGVVKVANSKSGYGLHVKIRNILGQEVVLAHLSEVFCKSGDYVHSLDKIGLSGNTGFSTGPHLHFGYRKIKGKEKDLFSWSVINHDNGFFGYVDILPYTVNWKGTHLQSTL